LFKDPDITHMIYTHFTAAETGASNCSECEEYCPLHPFKSDGCSCWPDGDWVECCVVRHDLVYWMGGTWEQRERADMELRDCLAKEGHPVVTWMIYYDVRVGGVWWLPSQFRWGFGRDYPESGPSGKPYQKLTAVDLPFVPPDRDVSLDPSPEAEGKVCP
jgi:hypothetical protein